MNTRRISLALLFAALWHIAPAQAAVGDMSYDPNPSIYDEDVNAQFDAFSLLTHAVTLGHNLPTTRLNFENGFTSGQELVDWVPLGNVAVRFGFGETLAGIQWRSQIGQVDTDPGAVPGLTHPLGTYGNAPGVEGAPRNYVTDNFFLTTPQGTPPSPGYFVIEFSQPIKFASFGIIDYATQTGGGYRMATWQSDTLTDGLAILGEKQFQQVDPDAPAGSFRYLVTPWNASPFNHLVVQLDTPDATVGFDNFTFSMAPVPEPETSTLLLIGLAALYLVARRKQSSC